MSTRTERSADGGPPVRVVCVTYNSGTVLEGFARSLTGATSLPAELVIVDNDSSDGAPERESARSDARVVHAGGNLGYGRAANLGAEGFAGEWLVVANPDIEWTPGSLDALVEAAQRWPRAGALGPLIREPDGSTYPSGRALPSVRIGVGHALLGKVWSRNPWTARYQRQQELTAATERSCGWLSGSCLLLRVEAFRAVGGFDPGYFMFFEDVDLGARLGQAGWQCVYAPSAVVVHLGGHSWRTAPEKMIRAHHTSALRYLRNRYDRWYHAPLRLGFAAGLAVRERVEVRAARRERAGGGPPSPQG